MGTPAKFISLSGTPWRALPYFAHKGVTTVRNDRRKWFARVAFIGLRLKRTASVGMERA